MTSYSLRRKLLLYLLLANALFGFLFLLTTYSTLLDGRGTKKGVETLPQKWISSSVNLPLHKDYLRVLLSHSSIFLLEPYYLVAQLNSKSTFSRLQRRFNLPPNWPPSPPSNSSKDLHLSVGIFADQFVQLEDDFLQFAGDRNYFRLLSETSTPASGRLTSVTYQSGDHLFLHLVLFYRFEGHFWARFSRSWKKEVGGEEDNFQNRTSEPITIFDPFNLIHINGIAFPEDISHYLSQLPTSRYLECTPESAVWASEKGVPKSEKMEAITVKAISSMKTLARTLEMEVWIASGTLLGWYRQCSVTPYTTDIDFASWAGRYVVDKSLSEISQIFKKTSSKTGLRLFQRFGTSKSSLEYSFSTLPEGEKVDLFFVYEGHVDGHPIFRSPLHDVQKGRFIFQHYPQFSLCSVLLLDLKVLAPCTPEEVVIAEYGPNWQEPIAKWEFTSSPVNFDPKGWQPWTNSSSNNETQWEGF